MWAPKIILAYGHSRLFTDSIDKKAGHQAGNEGEIGKLPEAYFTWIGKSISPQLIKGKGIPDFIHLFVQSKKEFESEMKKLRPFLKSNPKIIIWISWHKKSAGIPTDIMELDIRGHALRNGLVDVKVCAVSELWSGLKLVVPIAKR
ncbi:MAG: DUF3052 domain-containing protein [Bacteroidetes bacterium]|nr:DUF3052 domain-containing protein [Bacteroidota bacterium]